MTKKHKKIIVYFGVILLLLIAIGLWIFRPSPLYNINVVDERLQEIRFPLKAVEASYYLDGGSISILILNKNDNVIKLAIPIKASGYGNMYIGTLNISETPGTVLKNQEESKKMIYSILEESQLPWNTFALAKLRGRWKDYFGIICHKLNGDFNNNEIEKNLNKEDALNSDTASRNLSK